MGYADRAARFLAARRAATDTRRVISVESVERRVGEPPPAGVISVISPSTADLSTLSTLITQGAPVATRQRDPDPRPARRCYCCGTLAWRERATGGWVCGACHPLTPRPSFSLDHLSATGHRDRTRASGAEGHRGRDGKRR